MHPDRLRLLISILEVGLVLFFVMARVGLANFSLLSFIDILYWRTILSGTPLLRLIYLDILLMY